MASELPVVAYVVDGVSETIVNGETGHIFTRRSYLGCDGSGV